jgi:hypothetical protein
MKPWMIEVSLVSANRVDFRLIDEVVSNFEKVAKRCEVEVKGITSIECNHIQKFLVKEIITFTKLESMILEIEKHIHIFKHEKESLNFPMDQHVFPHQWLCKEEFEQWANYDVEHTVVETPRSPNYDAKIPKHASGKNFRE